MTLKTSFIVGLAVAALVVGVQTASAARTSDGSNRTNLAQPDSGQSFLNPAVDYSQGFVHPGGYPQFDYSQSFLYPGGYPQSGYGNPPASAPTIDYSQSFLYPGGYALNGLGSVGNPNVAKQDEQSFVYPGGYALSGLGYIGNPPVSASAADSGSGIDWPQQLGIGFGVGMVVLLGLILTVRVGRSHPLAH